MEAGLWICEKESLAEAVWTVVSHDLGVPAKREGQIAVVGQHRFAWLDGHAFEQVGPDHYLPEDVPTGASGRKVWRLRDYPVVPKKWVIQPVERKSQRLARIAELLRSTPCVYHLGDPDREGQVIVDEALEYFAFKGKVLRILVNDYNASKIREAIKACKSNEDRMFRGWYRWGVARSRYDWLLGLNGTRAMTCRGRELGFDGLLPVGSVQTPLLYIIRERDRAIESFKPSPYFTLSGEFTHSGVKFEAAWKARQDQAGLDPEGRLVDVTQANALASKVNGKQGSVKVFDHSPKAEAAPLTFSLLELQVEAFRRWKYTGQQVLDAAQKLYEIYKVATYPRSDVRYLSMAHHAAAPGVIASVLRLRPDLSELAKMLDATRKSAAFSDEKTASTPHHGIIPAVPESLPQIATWSQVERDVFDLIVRSYLAQFAPTFKFLHTQIQLEVESETFVASGKVTTDEGWKAVLADAPAVEESDAGGGEKTKRNEQRLPMAAVGEQVLCTACSTQARSTKAPPRFDEAMITDAMTNFHRYVPPGPARDRLKMGEMALGTPATFTGIVQGLKERELLVPVKPGSSKLMTSTTARALIDALPMSVKDPAQAGIFKAALDRVEAGDLGFDVFIAQTASWVGQVVEQARTLAMKLPLAPGATICPSCKATVLRRKEMEGRAFWYCGNWNREKDPCEAKFQDIGGKPLLKRIACPTCKTGDLRHKQGSKGPFWFCSNWSAGPLKCDAKYPDKNGAPDLAPRPTFACPMCKSGQLRLVDGKSKFWGCSRYSEGCKATYPVAKSGGPDLSAKRKKP